MFLFFLKEKVLVTQSEKIFSFEGWLLWLMWLLWLLWLLAALAAVAVG